MKVDLTDEDVRMGNFDKEGNAGYKPRDAGSEIIAAGGFREIRSKIVGITFEDRMEYIKLLKVGEKLELRRDRENPVDKNAIAVYNRDGKQLGYLKKELSESLAPRMDDMTHEFDCFVKEITGIEKQNLGCNIIIIEKVKQK